jgi:hypothetical protein
MQTSKVQTRGICQCCGREQAVVNGMMAKHGYTIKQGWFTGVCSGKNFAPVQVSRATTDEIIAQINAEIPELLAKADKVKSGEITPATAFTHVVTAYRKEIPYEQANISQQSNARNSLEWAYRNRARMGEQFVQTMTEIANKYHGQPLVKVEK